MSPLGRLLFDAGRQLASASQQRHRAAHAHYCGCGDYYICHQEPDHCAVPGDWTCPACEQDQQDAWVKQQARTR